MSEQDNDNISKFFQKVAKEPKIEFNESDWSKLEARLEANPVAVVPSRLSTTIKGIAAVVIAIVFVGGIYFSIDYFNLGEKEVAGSIPSTTGNKELMESTVADTSDFVKKDSNIQRLADQSISRKGLYLKKRSKQMPNQLDSKMTNITSHANIIVHTEKDPARYVPKSSNNNSKEIMRISQNEESLSTRNNVDGSNILANKKLVKRNEAQSDWVLNSGVISQNEGLAVPLPILFDSAQNVSSKEDSLFTKVSEIASKNDSIFRPAEALKKEESNPSSRWSIMFSFSPDFSSTSLRNYTSPGEAYGLVAHYQLISKLSISAGIIKSHKIYEGLGSEYKPGNNYWAKKTNNIIPQQIQGTCDVLEIPLSLQYRIANLKRSSLYFTSGISSYILLNESYHYNFENPNPGAEQGWDSPGSTQFLFSIANIALRYERSLSSNVSVGIEPYAKIPLSNIGWSNIKLYSVGASITVRYRFHKKKSPILFTPGRSPD